MHYILTLKKTLQHKNRELYDLAVMSNNTPILVTGAAGNFSLFEDIENESCWFIQVLAN
jgi:hypothetical protein